MENFEVTPDLKLIKVLASDASYNTDRDRISEEELAEADEIIAELAEDASPDNRHKIAQIMRYGIERMQQHALDFLGQTTDQKNLNYGDKAAFNVKTGGIKAYFQAKGATTPRSFVTGKQILVDTEEVSARPAINLIDLRTNRVKMADLLREANQAMTNKKLLKIEQVLQAGLAKHASPFYGAGTGIVQATLDKQLNYFRRLGPVTILGDIEAVSKLSELPGMIMSGESEKPAFVQRSNSMIDEMNNNGFIGRYKGCNVVCMTNAYMEGETTPILNPNWLYILPGSLSADARNLKVVNEGGVSSFESQNIDDLVFEVRLDQWFGAAFVTGRIPTIGAYKING